MTNPYPLPRSIRETEPIAGDGRVTYGPFGFQIWDPADVTARVSRAGADLVSEAITAAKVSASPFAHFTVTFTPALRPGDFAIVRSTRLHERMGDVTRGGSISGQGLERELSIQATVLQELRRDETRNQLTIDLERVERIADIAAERLTRASADEVLSQRIVEERDGRVAALALEERQRAVADTALASLIGQAGPIETQIFDSQLAARSAKVKSSIRTFLANSFDSPLDGGGLGWTRVANQPGHPGGLRTADRFLPDGSVSEANGGWWEPRAERFTAAMFGGNTATLIAVAFALNIPIDHWSEESVFLDLDLNANALLTDAGRFALLKRAVDWQARCRTYSPDSASGSVNALRIRLAKGLHKVEGFLTPTKGSSPTSIESAAVDTSRLVTSLAFAATGTANLFTVTCGVSTPLPAHVVPGFAIGLENVQGNGSAEACSGGQIVKTIAADRLSFTFDMWSRKAAPVAVTSIDVRTHAQAADQHSMNRSVVVIPDATLAVSPGSSGWNGGGVEGFFNVYGGEVRLRNVGLSYLGEALSHHDMFFIGAQGYLNFEARVIVSGAGDALLRMSNDGRCFLNRSCMGGAGKASLGIWTQNQASAQTLRISLGGFHTFGLQAGLGSGINFGGIVTNCHVAAQTNQYALITIPNCRISHSLNGVWAATGQIIGDTATRLENNGVAIQWSSGGIIQGDFVMVGNTTDVLNNTPKNTLFRNGAWITNIILDLFTNEDGVFLSVLNNTLPTSTMTSGAGAVGRIRGVNASAVGGIGFEVDVRAGTGITEARYLGANVVVGTGAITAPLNPGKVTISFFQDTDGQHKFRVLNETGGARAWRIFYEGTIRMGAFS